MRNETPNGASQPSATNLVSGILADVQQLLTQQTQLLRLEVREDLARARTGAVFLGVGIGITAVGGLLFCLMLPHLLNWLMHWPLWICFCIFGVVFLFLGGGASFVALKKFQHAAALPETTTTLKENLACLLRQN